MLLAALVAVAGCAGRLAPGTSTQSDLQAALGAPAERRQVGAESWLYYPNQPYGRTVVVARVGPDGRLVALEQRLSDQYIAKLVPDQSRREDVLALFGQPYQRVTYPRLQREAWTWHMKHFTTQPAGLHVQISPDGVVREVYVLDEGDHDRPPSDR